MWVLNPIYVNIMVWALSRSLATTQEIVDLLSFPLGTQMVQFPRFPSNTLYIHVQIPANYRMVCFHIQKSSDHSSSAAPRSLSQLITSFIGAQCQGIHRTLLVALSNDYFLLLSYALACLLILVNLPLHFVVIVNLLSIIIVKNGCIYCTICVLHFIFD